MNPLYDATRRVFFAVLLVSTPVHFFIDAPFGRFSLSDSILLVHGIYSWIVMELVAPIAFVYALVRTPLATSSADVAPLTPAALFFASLFLIHYANRALLSPLRTPSRSKSHLMIVLFGMFFNTVNGTLLGTYLRSPTVSAFLAESNPLLLRPRFWIGFTLWAAGFAGNILHDEILLNIRRNARAKGKARAKSPSSSSYKKQPREHYGVPHGYLYTFISFPNYLCEWIEWFGFALAAAPPPDLSSLAALVDSVHPPWVFFVAEVCVMFGRAYKGHQWYLKTLPDYPKDRRAVIPFVC